jgi:predicted transcriptional regulator YdeE
MPETIHIEGLTNAEFFERHAAPGRIGLYGGPELINRMIGRAQRHLDETKAWSRWSHAFLFQGRRHDGHHWIVESDLDFHRKHIRLGVQENRVTKYHDDAHTTALAVIDLGLTPAQVERVLANALEMVAQRTRYSLREIAGTAWAMRHPEWRPRGNLLARDRAFFCSAFVRHAIAAAGIDLAAGIDEKNTAPEHIMRTTVPHTKWVMARGDVPVSKVRGLVRRVKAKLRVRS